jgi:hypothetical protein
MPKKRKPKKSRYQRLADDYLDQQFLIVVACMVLGILSFGQIFSSNKPPVHDDARGHHGSSYSNKAVKGATTPPPRVPIAVWHGPVQPIAIAPGLPPVIDRVPVSVPVVFVTIDDGWVQTPQNLDWLTSHHLPFTMFLSDAGIRSNYQYFQSLQAAGMTVQNHSVSHHSLPKMTADQQKGEICGASDIYQSVFTHRPTLFRPPYGEYSDVTRQVVADCGMRAVIMWKATLEGGAIHFQLPNTKLQAGDIILLHFEPDLIPNMDALARQLAQDHLQVAQLEDWIK